MKPQISPFGGRSSIATQPQRIIRTRDPDPGKELIVFFSWLKKRGGVKRLTHCEMKFGKRIDIRRALKEVGRDIAMIQIHPRDGDEIVHLVDLVWADQWMSVYDCEVPHHGQIKPLEKIFSATEKKSKD